MYLWQFAGDKPLPTFYYDLSPSPQRIWEPFRTELSPRAFQNHIFYYKLARRQMKTQWHTKELRFWWHGRKNRKENNLHLFACKTLVVLCPLWAKALFNISLLCSKSWTRHCHHPVSHIQAYTYPRYFYFDKVTWARCTGTWAQHFINGIILNIHI